MNKIKTPRHSLRLLTCSRAATTGWLTLGPQRLACQLGQAGRTALKREGDGATPQGDWPLQTVFYRADRISRPRTKLRVKPLQPSDGWCDDPLDRNYNRPVQLPYPTSAETLWRDDHAYDLVVVLDQNFSRRSRNRGSAIFLHLTHDDQRPTAGCLAFREQDLRRILLNWRQGTMISI